ncbi:hypothetical protein AG0111_0g11849 [Alternaria gaisen]|uniref:Uncharacterized protein n=1 Tax=Alternaria gaisen TaxID=167740 RepID=A0ACB6F5P6_9PLEO|nr:hypothetical protein AG0111_0g11849 [Alternaria gaisen]
MPPKARKRSAKAPAPLVDPWLADVLAASTEAKTATRKLNEMVEGDPGVEEQTEKAGAAQRTLIEAATDLVTLLAIKESKPPETSHEEEVALLTLYDLVHQYRNAKDDHGKSQCSKQMQETANRLVETGTKDMRFQVGKPWLPSAKDDEDGQKQRIREPIESFTNDDEPLQDAFIPYRKPKTDETVFADRTRISVDLRTGIAISEDKKKTGNDEEMADVEEYSKEHGHGDHEDAHGDVDVEAGSQESDSFVHPEGDTSSSTVGGGGQEQQGEALGALRQPLSEVGALCTVCDLSKPVSDFRLLWRGKGECYECEAQEDARLRSKG